MLVRMLKFEQDWISGGATFEAHGHATPHVLAVLDGSVTERVDNRLRDLKRGAFRVSGAQISHDLHFGTEGANCLVLESNGPFWSRIVARAARRGAGSNVFGNTANSEDWTNARGAEDLAQRLPALLSFGRMLAFPESQRATRPTWLADAIDLIERNEVKHLRHVARTLERDRIHLTREFGMHLGFRPSEFRALRRGASALRLISTTHAPLADIAAECGYAHQSHMTRVLRSLFGHPPSHWRA